MHAPLVLYGRVVVWRGGRREGRQLGRGVRDEEEQEGSGGVEVEEEQEGSVGAGEEEEQEGSGEVGEG